MTRPKDASSEAGDPAIAHHYVFILLVESAVLLALAWLAAHYR